MWPCEKKDRPKELILRTVFEAAFGQLLLYVAIAAAMPTPNQIIAPMGVGARSAPTAPAVKALPETWLSAAWAVPTEAMARDTVIATSNFFIMVRLLVKAPGIAAPGTPFPRQIRILKMLNRRKISLWGFTWMPA